MSKKIYVEPEKIRKFARDLQNFRSNTGELTSRLKGNLDRLSQTWQDQEFQKFKDAFDTAQQRLQKFSAEVEQTLPKLERDASRAEEIHKGGIPNN